MDELPVQLQQLSTLITYRKALADKLEAADAEIKARKTGVQSAMEAAGTTLFACDGITAEIKTQRAYRAVDWPSIYQFITEHGAFELLHRRLSVTALDEYAKARGLPPGVVADSYEELKIKEKA